MPLPTLTLNASKEQMVFSLKSKLKQYEKTKWMHNALLECLADLLVEEVLNKPRHSRDKEVEISEDDFFAVVEVMLRDLESLMTPE